MLDAPDQEGNVQYYEFVEQVRDGARMATPEDAVRAIRATLKALGEHLPAAEIDNLAAQLPSELRAYLRQSNRHGGGLTLDRFFERITEHGAVDLPQAIHQARAVIAALRKTVNPDEMAHLRAHLPTEFRPLFKPANRDKVVRG